MKMGKTTCLTLREGPILSILIWARSLRNFRGSKTELKTMRNLMWNHLIGIREMSRALRGLSKGLGKNERHLVFMCQSPRPRRLGFSLGIHMIMLCRRTLFSTGRITCSMRCSLKLYPLNFTCRRTRLRIRICLKKKRLLRNSPQPQRDLINSIWTTRNFTATRECSLDISVIKTKMPINAARSLVLFANQK